MEMTRIIIICIFLIFSIFIYINNSYALNEDHMQIAKIGTSDSFLTAYNDKGDPVWVYKFETDIKFHDFADLDGNGNNEIIIVTKDEGDQPNFLYVINSHGHKLWYYDFSKIKNIYNGSSNRFIAWDLLVKNLWNNQTKNIIVSLRNSPYYATNLMLFDHNGSILGNYWHPGNIYDIEVIDIDNDGIKEIVCGGVNNDWSSYDSYYRPVIFVLNPARMDGQATPWLGCYPHASEKHYIILPKSEIRAMSCAVKEIWCEDDLVVALLDDDRFFYFDQSMKLVGSLSGVSLTNTEINKRNEMLSRLIDIFAGAMIGAILALILPPISIYLKRKL